MPGRNDGVWWSLLIRSICRERGKKETHRQTYTEQRAESREQRAESGEREERERLVETVLNSFCRDLSTRCLVDQKERRCNIILQANATTDAAIPFHSMTTWFIKLTSSSANAQIHISCWRNSHPVLGRLITTMTCVAFIYIYIRIDIKTTTFHNRFLIISKSYFEAAIYGLTTNLDTRIVFQSVSIVHANKTADFN